MFLPIKDNLKIVNTPMLTILLIIVNCFVFITFESNQVSAVNTIVLHGAVPYELMHDGTQCLPVDGENFRCMPTRDAEREYQMKFPSAWANVGSSMFLHLGWFHLLGNMLFLYVFGRAVEDTLGRLNYLLFYLVGGIGAILAHTLYDPNSQVPCVGASGAIAAVMAAYFVMYSRARVTSLFILYPCRPRALWVIGVWLGEQALIAWNSAGSGAVGGTAVFAHFGGFAVGCLLTYLVVGTDEIHNQRLRANFETIEDDAVRRDGPAFDPNNPHVPLFVTHDPSAPPPLRPDPYVPTATAPPKFY